MPVDPRAVIMRAATRYGLDPQVMLRIAALESGMNPAVRNPRSSAGGLFQFIDGTAREYGLADRFDPVQAADAAARLTLANQAALRSRLGRAPTGAELYLAHQQGAGGAGAILSQPDAPVATLVGDQAARLNGGGQGMTARDFAARWTARYDGADPGEPVAAAPALPRVPELTSLFGPAAPVDTGPVASMFGANRQRQQERVAAERARRQALFAA